LAAIHENKTSITESEKQLPVSAKTQSAKKCEKEVDVLREKDVLFLNK
jgi:hypothetical protein